MTDEMRKMLFSFALAQITLVMAVSAGVCYISTEPDESGRFRFVLPPEDPCSCTQIKMGGHNTVAPHRITPPVYLDSLPMDAQTFRKSYGCPEWTTPIADTTTVATTQELPKTAIVTSHSDCQAIRNGGYTESGLYTVQSPGGDAGAKTHVYCHMDNRGNGFIVIQRRFNGSERFDRSWNKYSEGFGDLNGEFWWGNENLRSFTENGDEWKLRVSLTAFDGDTRTYNYDSFSISGNNYDLNVDDFQDANGREEDGFVNHQQSFSTQDMDNDGSGALNCAATLNGGWWFKKCNDYDSFLNGVYSNIAQPTGGIGIKWSPWKGKSVSLKRSEMMIRP